MNLCTRILLVVSALFLTCSFVHAGERPENDASWWEELFTYNPPLSVDELKNYFSPSQEAEILNLIHSPKKSRGRFHYMRLQEYLSGGKAVTCALLVFVNGWAGPKGHIVRNQQTVPYCVWKQSGH